MRLRTSLKNSSLVLSMVVVLVSGAGAVHAQTSSFTYQGRLTDGGTAANGNYDLQFGLWDSSSGGAQIGPILTLNSVAVSNGVFIVSLDFGASGFNGASRFLEISARPVSGAAFTLLSPRLQVTATPYAIRSANASLADNATTATNAAQLGGVAAGQYVQTSDSRLSDSRTPTAGSSNYIQSNPGNAQSANFNISGNGTLAGTLSAAQFNIGNNRVLAITGGSSPGNLNSNAFVGAGAGAANTPGSNIIDGNLNSFFGSNAGNSNTTGDDNSFFGSAAGGKNTTGALNSFFGSFAGASLVSGFENAFFGQGAGAQTTGGNQNSFFGTSAGSGQLSGISNTAFGYSAQVSTGLTNATAIGANAQVEQSNALVLGSINNKNLATADTNVGIGTSTPRSALEVKRNWDGSFGALTLTGDRPTIRFSGGAISGNDQWILHLGSAAGSAPAGSLSFFFGGTAGNAFGAPVLSVTPAGTVEVGNLGSAGGTPLCRNSSNEIANCSSSLRYKTNINTFAGGLDIINRLRPISFKWKQDGTSDIGFGAEEVEKIAPLFTFRNDKGQIEGVRYDRLSVLFVNAFKEQQTQIEKQQEQIKRQQAQMKEQQAALAAQRQELAAFKKLICGNRTKARACRTR